MNKATLQNLCHERAWDLPDYAPIKQGPDHNPRFRATVTVNGISFHSQSHSKSYKEAQNEAAKLAVDHFTSSPPDPPSVASPDMQQLFKNQLQRYAHKRGLAHPVYYCERVGPSQASRFKCKVTIGAQTYESQDFFPTLSKAEHAAAKAALMSLAPSEVEEDESAYKNLLQELTQKEFSPLPAYTVSRSGEAHRPTFISTVVVEGESFTGQDAKTKKLAELSAAKVAYTALKLRKSRQNPTVSSTGNLSNNSMASCFGESQNPMAAGSATAGQNLVSRIGNSSQSGPGLFASQQGQKVVQSTPSPRSVLAACLQQNVQPMLPEHSEQAEVKREIADVVGVDHPIASPRPESNSALKRISSPLVSTKHSSSPSDSSPSLPVTIEHPAEANIPRHNKVIVHPNRTNMTSPPGITVLTLIDGNWVAVRTPQSRQ